MPKVRKPTNRRVLHLEVRDRDQVSPHFLSITLGGPDVAWLEEQSGDQCGRLFFRRPGQERLWLPTMSHAGWMAQTLARGKSDRPFVRMYTVRRFRRRLSEIDIEFAMHGTDSPATTWAAGAEPGEPAGFLDEGSTFALPPGCERIVLVGDDSSLPAIAGILDTVPGEVAVDVFVELEDVVDIRHELGDRRGLNVHWLERDPDGRRGDTVAGLLAETALSPTGTYAWVAGESRLTTTVRRHLVADRGIPRSAVTFVGYWRSGVASIG